ncbi:MAG: prepilin-type N-terminal cleavage/methylation domain-containing protein [Thermodesulfovibrio sp.]
MESLRNSKGFTLVELAIVLVIIGIIIGAVLKGQELINNAKIKRAYNQYREILAAFYTYYDKYGKYPGDDNTAQLRWPGSTNGNNNGVIEGFEFNCNAGATTETCQAWLHMRLANILTGATDNNGTKNPSNIYGGNIAIGYAFVQGLATMWIGFQNVPGEVCLALDQLYDDGNYNTGSIRGSGNYNTSPNGFYYLYFRL